MTTLPGNREKFYVQGYNFSRGPAALEMKPDIGETRTRARSGKQLVHHASPFSGCCKRWGPFTLTFTWDVMAGPDIDTANDIIASGEPLDVCIWRPITEAFMGGSGTLARRNAIDVISSGLLPIGAATKYALVGIRAGVADTVTLGSIDTNFRTPWTSVGTSGIIFIRYYPVFRVNVAEGQPLFSSNNAQGQKLSFEEA